MRKPACWAKLACSDARRHGIWEGVLMQVANELYGSFCQRVGIILVCKLVWLQSLFSSKPTTFWGGWKVRKKQYVCEHWTTGHNILKACWVDSISACLSLKQRINVCNLWLKFNLYCLESVITAYIFSLPLCLYNVGCLGAFKGSVSEKNGRKSLAFHLNKYGIYDAVQVRLAQAPLTLFQMLGLPSSLYCLSQGMMTSLGNV